MTNSRLELTWFNKDKALLSSVDGEVGYEWVERDDRRFTEVALTLQAT